MATLMLSIFHACSAISKPAARRTAMLVLLAHLAACADLANIGGVPEPTAAWVQMGPAGAVSIRAITNSGECPQVRFDDKMTRMAERAPPDNDFKVRVCEAAVPTGAKTATVAGRWLRLPPNDLRRIAVVGDTGCRLKSGKSPDDGFQACNDPDEWPLKKVAAQVAAWQPDLILHVGDYLYREQPCPIDQRGCAGSPFNSPGNRWLTWNADYFTPAAAMLQAAPFVFVRGDHETCARAGRGWFRFFDPRPFQTCVDSTEPYSIEFPGLQLLVMDTILADDVDVSSKGIVSMYAAQFEQLRGLINRKAWLLSHRPLWGIRTTDRTGVNVEQINATLQAALSAPLSGEIELVLTGHIHLGEILNFTGNRPPQIIAGAGGTLLLPNVKNNVVGMPIGGEQVTEAAILAKHGFFAFEREGAGWKVSFRDVEGKASAACRLAAKSVHCGAQ